MVIFKWAMALIIGGFLLFFGVTKFTGAAHIFPYIEFRAGGLGLPFAELFFPFVNWATGALEIAAGALLILPATRRLGAVIAVAPFAGAVGFHLSPLLGVTTPDGFSETLPAAALAAGGPFARSDFSESASSGLFTIAAVMLILAAINVFVQRRA